MAAWPAAGAPIGKAGGKALASGTAFTNSDLAYDASFTGWLMVEAGTQNGSTGQTEVVAMLPTNGSIKWDVALPSGPTPGSFNTTTEVGIFSSDVGNSAPAIDAVDGTVYVGNVNGLYALVGATGAIKTGFPYIPSQDTGAKADVDSAPAIGGDRTVFFGTAGGTFYAVNPDGTERYHYKTGGRISSSPAIGPDGTVFFVSDDGNLYALR
jgi:outer membrane protein assembly factor BamB